MRKMPQRGDIVVVIPYEKPGGYGIPENVWKYAIGHEFRVSNVQPFDPAFPDEPWEVALYRKPVDIFWWPASSILLTRPLSRRTLDLLTSLIT